MATDSYQKAVELRFRQWEGADLMCRVLCRDNKKRFRQGARGTFDRDLSLFHCLQQRALSFRRGAVDFIRYHDLGENRTGVKAKAAGIAVEHRYTDDVGRQHVAGKLNALEVQPEQAR